MISANGKIIKKICCPNCLHLINWDTPEDEISLNGHRGVNCPNCGIFIDICPPTEIEIQEVDVIENPQGTINGNAIADASIAIKNLTPKDTMIVNSDIDVGTAYTSITGTIDLNGHTLTCSTSIESSGSVVLKNGTIKYTTTDGSSAAISVKGKSSLTLDNVTINSDNEGITVKKNGTLTIKDSNITSTRGAINPIGNSITTIENCTLKSTSSFAVGTNGSTGREGDRISIINSKITGKDCAIYSANNNKISIKRTTLSATAGSGIIVRGGAVSVSTTSTITAYGSGNTTTGDSSIELPMGKQIIIDKKSAYPAVESISVDAPGKNIYEVTE